MYSKIPWASSTRVSQRLRSNSSVWTVAKKLSAVALTPLYVKKGSCGALLSVAVVGHDPLVDLSGDESFQAADDVSFGEPFGGASGDVVDSGLVVSHPDDHGPVYGGVGLSVSAPVEAVTVGHPR